MSRGKWVRQFHRWLSAVFTAGVIVNLCAIGRGKEPAFWVYLLALVPLAVLQLTGMYLFALPYTTQGRAERRGVE